MSDGWKKLLLILFSVISISYAVYIVWKCGTSIYLDYQVYGEALSVQEFLIKNFDNFELITINISLIIWMLFLVVQMIFDKSDTTKAK